MRSSADAWKPLDVAGTAARPIGPSWLPDLAHPIRPVEEPEPEDVARLRAEHARLVAEREQGAARVTRAVELLGNAAAQLEALAHEFTHDRERNLHALAVAIARGIVQRELTADPTLVGTLDNTLEIRMHPDDLGLFGPGAPALLPEGRTLEVQWVPDGSLERGSFVIESPQRLVDGRTDTALRQLYERLEHD